MERRAAYSKPRVIHVQKVRGIAGSERHLLLLCKGLVSHDWHVTMAVLEEPGRPVDEYLQELARVGVDARRFTLRADVDPVCLLRLYRYMARGGFDLAHTHLIHGDLYGTIAARLAGVGSVVSSKHGYDDYCHPSPLYRLTGRLDRWVNRVITISDALKPLVERIEGIPARKMTTVHYGLEVTPERSPRGSKSGEGDFTLATVGRLVPVKGIEYLLDALASMAAGGSRARLLVIGDGPERQRLEQRATMLGLSTRVEFLGWSRNVAAELVEADAFVTATLGEGFGLAVLEAMMQGLPVVATDTVAIPEIVVHEETGLLVPPANPRALADALSRLEHAPTLRAALARRGRERAVDKFSISAMVSATEAIYRETLEAAGYA